MADLARNETIKARSDFLRGTLADELDVQAFGGLGEDDGQLIKFHGAYQQDDRDLRSERKRQKLEKAYSFMVRIRVPGGVATPAQWLEVDRLATQYANGTIKLKDFNITTDLGPASQDVELIISVEGVQQKS